jgi:HD-like signal output (HDOD) protein
MFMAGLLHELGLVVLDQYAHGVFVEMLAAVAGPGQKIEAVERAFIGTSHAEIGYWVAEAWHLPEMLGAAIRWHHQPFSAGEHVLAAAIVAAADILCMSEEEFNKEWMSGPAGEVFAWLRLDESAQAQILAAADQELAAIEAFMAPANGRAPSEASPTAGNRTRQVAS